MYAKIPLVQKTPRFNFDQRELEKFIKRCLPHSYGSIVKNWVYSIFLKV